MAAVATPQGQQHESVNGTLTVDSRGRIVLPKVVREVLNLEPGATLHYLILGGALWLTPPDEQWSAWNGHQPSIQAERPEEGNEEVDPAQQAILDELPAIRDQVAREMYGDAFIDELTRRHAEILAAQGDQAQVDRIDADR